MAKQKNSITLGDSFNEFQEDKDIESAKQKQLDEQQGRGEASTDPKDKVDPKGKGSDWRRKERPIQKTVHFDRPLHQKINFLKQIEDKPVEDIIYDIVSQWFDQNFEQKKKELLGQI